jgi:hypothetical protein
MNDDLAWLGGLTRGRAPLFVDPTGQIIAVDGGRSVNL